MTILEETYNKLSRKERTDYRLKVCFTCGWTSSITFYRKMYGETPIRNLELEAIEKINTQINENTTSI